MTEMNQLSAEELEAVSGGTGGSRTPLPYKAGCIVYQIRKGDKLGAIARNYHTTCEAIKAVNPTIKNVNDITAGYYIYIPQ
jgi:LysM repeat protein